MNCTSARNQLLTDPDPVAVPDVAGHLAECTGCQAWHRVLTQVDRAVATAPVPATTGRIKRRLIELFRTGRPTSESRTGVVVPATTRKTPDRLARMWPAGLVAAALLVGALSWLILGGKQDGGAMAQLPPDPFLKQVVAAKVKIDTAETPAERLKAWANLADDLHDQAKELYQISPSEDMESLAGLYEQAVGDDALIGQARLLSDGDRKATLQAYVDKLAGAEEAANALAAKAKTGSDRPLKRIADAAAASRTKLAVLQQGRAS